jgi:NAD(P)H dehydrogenase (quinone)
LTPVRCLIVLAHPLGESLSAHLAKVAGTQARAVGWDVTVRDLYADDFDPRLIGAERASYYTGFDGTAVATERAELQATDVLILVFPTWWFSFPAILKGWFDRVWAPGTAYDHAPDFGPMRPRLTNLRGVLGITTMGSPAWVDWLIMFRPLQRILRWAIIRPCAPQSYVRSCTLYRAETADPERIARFEAGMTTEIKAMARRLTCPD